MENKKKDESRNELVNKGNLFQFQSQSQLSIMLKEDIERKNKE